MRISDWSSDVCSSDLPWQRRAPGPAVDFSISVGGVSQWLRPGAWPRHGPRLALAHARLAGGAAGGDDGDGLIREGLYRGSMTRFGRAGAGGGKGFRDQPAEESGGEGEKTGRGRGGE